MGSKARYHLTREHRRQALNDSIDSLLEGYGSPEYVSARATKLKNVSGLRKRSKRGRP